MLQRLGQTGGTEGVKGPWQPWARVQAANNHCSLAQSGAGRRLRAGRNHGPPGREHSTVLGTHWQLSSTTLSHPPVSVWDLTLHFKLHLHGRHFTFLCYFL